MKTVKWVIFLSGLILINFVVGMPGDMRNYFATHLVFLSPLLFEYHSILSVKTNSFNRFLINLFYVGGLIALAVNISGVFGVFELVNIEGSSSLVFSGDFAHNFISLPLNSVILGLTLVYVFLFTGTVLKVQSELKSREEEKVTTKRGVVKDAVSG